MIVFDNVQYRYHYEEFALFKGLSFTLEEGVNTILCAEQSGKTSLCKLLCGQITPNSGQITFDGINIYERADNGVLHLPKNPVFFENKSALYNVCYPLQVRKVAKMQRDIIGKMLLEECCLPLDVKAKRLDKEQRRQLALARGKSVDRRVVLLDDFVQSKEQIDQIARQFEGATLVVLTSKPHLAVGYTVVLDGGEVIFAGNCDEGAKLASSLIGMIKE